MHMNYVFFLCSTWRKKNIYLHFSFRKMYGKNQLWASPVLIAAGRPSHFGCLFLVLFNFIYLHFQCMQKSNSITFQCACSLGSVCISYTYKRLWLSCGMLVLWSTMNVLGAIFLIIFNIITSHSFVIRLINIDRFRTLDWNSFR